MTRPRQIEPRDRDAWTGWLDAHHATAVEVTVVFHRKGSPRPSITYAEAVEEALCFGWIDGVKHKLDEWRYSHRFTPRRPGGTWSELNKRRLAALLAAGKIRPAGQVVIDAAQRSGAWDRPARTPVPAEIPAELAAALAGSARARRAYDALAPSHQREWKRWIADAKQAETRARRAAKTVAQLASGAKDPRA